MSFEFAMKRKLEQSGLSLTQAEQIIELAKKDEALDSFKERWGDTESEYPPAMVNVLWISVKTIALEWIDENIPQAWFRPMFL